MRVIPPEDDFRSESLTTSPNFNPRALAMHTLDPERTMSTDEAPIDVEPQTSLPLLKATDYSEYLRTKLFRLQKEANLAQYGQGRAAFIGTADAERIYPLGPDSHYTTDNLLVTGNVRSGSTLSDSELTLPTKLYTQYYQKALQFTRAAAQIVAESDSLNPEEKIAKEQLIDELADKLKGYFFQADIDRTGGSVAASAPNPPRLTGKAQQAALQLALDAVTTTLSTYAAEISPSQSTREQLKTASKAAFQKMVMKELEITWQDGRPPRMHINNVTIDGQDYTTVEVEEPLGALTTELKQEFLRINEDEASHPYWLKDLAKHHPTTYALLKKIVPAGPNGDWSRVERTLPTTLSFVPGQRNYTRNTYMLLDSDGKVISKNSIIRHGTPIPFGVGKESWRKSTKWNILSGLLVVGGAFLVVAAIAGAPFLAPLFVAIKALGFAATAAKVAVGLIGAALTALPAAILKLVRRPIREEQVRLTELNIMQLTERQLMEHISNTVMPDLKFLPEGTQTLIKHYLAKAKEEPKTTKRIRLLTQAVNQYEKERWGLPNYRFTIAMSSLLTPFKVSAIINLPDDNKEYLIVVKQAMANVNKAIGNTGPRFQRGDVALNAGRKFWTTENGPNSDSVQESDQRYLGRIGALLLSAEKHFPVLFSGGNDATEVRDKILSTTAEKFVNKFHALAYSDSTPSTLRFDLDRLKAFPILHNKIKATLGLSSEEGAAKRRALLTEFFIDFKRLASAHQVISKLHDSREAVGDFRDRNDQRNLRRAAMFLIVNAIFGGGSTNCKSSKDRNGATHEEMEANEIYFTIRGHYPDPTQPDDKLLRAIRRVVLSTGYQAASAASNSVGSSGLKDQKQGGIRTSEYTAASKREKDAYQAYREAHNAAAHLNKTDDGPKGGPKQTTELSAEIERLGRAGFNVYGHARPARSVADSWGSEGGRNLRHFDDIEGAELNFPPDAFSIDLSRLEQQEQEAESKEGSSLYSSEPDSEASSSSSSYDSESDESEEEEKSVPRTPGSHH